MGRSPRATPTYFSREKQDAESEDCGQLDDGKQQLVGLHHALRLLADSSDAPAVPGFPFQDGHQGGGDQKHHSPEEEEVWSGGEGRNRGDDSRPRGPPPNGVLVPDRLTRPTSLGSALRYLLQKSADSRARKSTLPMKYPVVWPTELHVEA